MSELGSISDVGAQPQRPLWPYEPTSSALSLTSEKCHVWTASGWQVLSSRTQAWVMCGRLRVGKCFHHVRRLGSCVDGSGLASAFITYAGLGQCSHVFGL